MQLRSISPTWLTAVWTALILAVHPPMAAAAAKASRGLPVVFSRPGGSITNAFELTLESKTPGSAIVYTLDGSEPGPHSPKYTGPIAVTNSVRIRARALQPIRGTLSETVSQSYLLLAADLWDFSSNLPLMLIQTFGSELTRDDKTVATLVVQSSAEGRASLTRPHDYLGEVLLNLRGRASLRYPKRSYTVKTLGSGDDYANVPLLGLPRDSDWVLYAPYPDKTLMRDVLAYEMSRQIGRWAPQTRFVEVFLSESNEAVSRDQYLGVYVLEERIKRSEARVDLQKLGPEHSAMPDLTGGYIFKKDHSDQAGGPTFIQGYPPFEAASSSSKTGFPTGPGGFPGAREGFLPPFTGRSSSSSSSSSSRSTRSSRAGLITNVIGAPVVAKRESTVTRTVFMGEDGEEVIRVEDEEPSLTQSFKTSVLTNRFYYVEPEPDEITGVQRAWLIRHLNDAERALAGPDFKDAARGYAAFIDPASFIDYHLLVEVTKNVDGFRFSTFYHKDRLGKIRMGPLWDWNLSFGNCNGKQGFMPEYWLWPQLDDREYSWFRRLFEDPDFGQAYVDRWWALRHTTFSHSNLLGRVDALASQLDEAQKRNFERWPILGVTINPNWFLSDSYAGEVAWMKEWIAKRLTWIDAQFIPPPIPRPEPEGRLVLTAATPGDEIYFTRDGTDPRQAGGAISTRAVKYSPENTPKSGDVVMARIHRSGRWSGPLRLDRTPARGG